MKKIFLMIMAVTALKSFGQAPDTWSVDPNDFTYDMSVVARVEVNGRISRSSNDKVAAFIDGEVVGVGSPDVNVPSTGDVVVFLTVYSNQASGKTVTFQIYDAQTNEVLDAVRSLAFENNAQIGSSTEPYIISDNVAPSGIDLTASSINENVPAGTTVGVLSTVDENHGSGFTYALVTGAGDSGNASFSLEDDKLKTAVVLNYEVQTSLSVRIKSTDPKGASFEKQFDITVNDQNDAPTGIELTASIIDENNAPFDEVAVLSAIDEDANESFIFSLTGNQDETSFEIRDGNSLTLAEAADYETKSSYEISVTVTDNSGSGLSFTKNFTISISDVNETPTSISVSNLEVTENNEIGEIVGTLSVEDVDAGDTHTYSFSSGSDTNGDFLIDGVNLKMISKSDYEEKSIYFVTIMVTDAAKNTYSQQFEINILDENEPPNDVYLSNNSVAENKPSGSFVGRLSVNDVDDSDTFTYSLIDGDGDTDNSSFEVVDDELVTQATFDFESKSTYEVRVQATDEGSNTLEKSFSLTITDANDGPTDIKLSKLSFNENNDVGQEVATISVTDQDATDEYVYQLLGNEDDGSFSIVEDKLYVQDVFDFETTTELGITIQVTDDGGEGFTYQKSFTLKISDVNEASTSIFLSNNEVTENNSIGKIVGALSVEDVDAGDTHTYSFSSGLDTDGDFLIDGVNFKMISKSDYEEKSIYFVTIMVTDAAKNTYSQQFEINILDENEPPNDVYLSNNSVAENKPSGSFVGRLSVNDVDDSDTFTYSLIDGDGDTDNSSFEVVDDELVTQATFDFESKSTYEVRIQAKDDGSNVFQKSFSLTITDANDGPTDIKLSKLSFNENNDVGQEIATISVTDQDATDEYVYQLFGAEDDGSFSIVDDKLYVQDVFDFETITELGITIQVTDDGGKGFAYQKRFNLDIQNQNEAPEAINLTRLDIPEHTAIGEAIAELTADDSDSLFGETHTFSFSSGTDTSGPFFIEGTDLILVEKVNYEAKKTYFVALQVTDISANTYTQQFKLVVTDENDAPTGLTLGGQVIEENLPENSIVGTFAAQDEDDQDTFTYSLVAGTGGIHNDSFIILDDQLKTKQTFDFETTDNLSVRVMVEDASGAAFEKQFSITVLDGNDAPTGLSLSNATVEENLASGTLIGVFSTDDPDSDDVFQYVLSGTDAAILSGYFEISGNQLKTKIPLDAEAQGQFLLTVSATDNGLSTITEDFVIQVLSVNESPVFKDTIFYVPESAGVDFSLGFLAGTDVDGDELTYQIVRGKSFFDESLAAFKINGETGEIMVSQPDSINYEKWQEVVYSILVTDSGTPQLKAEALLKIKVQDEVEAKILPVNEIITPNGDGYNDFFHIQNIELYEDYTLQVYKGSGIEVYRNKPYANEWNGVSQNGKDLEPGVYYYKFFNVNGEVYKGTVTIIRK